MLTLEDLYEAYQRVLAETEARHVSASLLLGAPTAEGCVCPTCGQVRQSWEYAAESGVRVWHAGRVFPCRVVLPLCVRCGFLAVRFGGALDWSAGSLCSLCRSLDSPR